MLLTEIGFPFLDLILLEYYINEITFKGIFCYFADI